MPCLLARKLSEAGVRFVQVGFEGWDHHVNICENLPKSCAEADQPVAALISDLKSRGLLDETLVLWSGEFGRTPWSQDLSGTAPLVNHGRDDQPESFCAWTAGGGIRRGFTFGETDDLGYRAVSGKIHIHDLHATILHQLGIIPSSPGVTLAATIALRMSTARSCQRFWRERPDRGQSIGAADSPIRPDPETPGRLISLSIASAALKPPRPASRHALSFVI